MIKLKDLLTEDCWKGYRQYGMKKKGDKLVPNCVPAKDEEVVQEVGEGSSMPYDWKVVRGDGIEDEMIVKFTTDLDTEYEVNIEPTTYFEDGKGQWLPDAAVEISFFVAQNTSLGRGWTTKVTVNKGELYRVMSTITAILKAFLRNNPEVNVLIYSPTKKPSENIFGDQRDLLYRAFIKKAMPTAQIIKKEGMIVAKLK